MDILPEEMWEDSWHYPRPVALALSGGVLKYILKAARESFEEEAGSNPLIGHRRGMCGAFNGVSENC